MKALCRLHAQSGQGPRSSSAHPNYSEEVSEQNECAGEACFAESINIKVSFSVMIQLKESKLIINGIFIQSISKLVN